MEIFEEETIPRINPDVIIKLISEHTIEEKIKKFQPKITANSTKIHGVHSLISDDPFYHQSRPQHSDRKRSNSPTWQQLLFNPGLIPETLEKNEEENETDSKYEDYFDIDGELTPIEQFGMKLIQDNVRKII